jgi:soluble lytic murein transglycosylase-like protein
VSATALSGLEPITAAAAGGGEPIAATAAGERVQQLQALLEQVEQGPSLATFASALNAAQAGGPSSAAGASTSSALLANADLTADASVSPMSTSGAAYTSMLAGGYASTSAATDGYPSPATDGYPTAASPADGYTSAIPTTVAYDSATPAGASGAAGGGSTYAPMIEQAAARYGIDPSLLYGLIEQESGFDPSAKSSAGAAGLTQLMPSTAASLGVSEPLNPAQSIEGGARYLSQLLHQFAGNTTDALAAYNAGPGAVEQYGGVPPYPETQQYVAKVLGYAASFSPSGQDAGAAELPSTTAAIAVPTATTAAIATGGATASEAIA